MLMTLSLSIIKDLRNSFLIFTQKNSHFRDHRIYFSCFFIYFDLPFTRDQNDNITTKLLDEHVAFGIICYARCCSNYSNLISRHRTLVTRLLSLGYKVNLMSNTFKKFYGRHTDLAGQHKKNVCQRFADSIS